MLEHCVWQEEQLQISGFSRKFPELSSCIALHERGSRVPVPRLAHVTGGLASAPLAAALLAPGSAQDEPS